MQQLHEALIVRGLKLEVRGQTLSYFVRDSDGNNIALAALRVPGSSLFSFPKGYWLNRAEDVDVALSGILPSSIVEIEAGVSSSQYSMRQVAISSHTLPILLRAIDGVIAEHAESVARHA